MSARILILRLHDQANIEQTSSWLVQLTRASSSSQLIVWTKYKSSEATRFP